MYAIGSCEYRLSRQHILTVEQHAIRAKTMIATVISTSDQSVNRSTLSRKYIMVI